MEHYPRFARAARLGTAIGLALVTRGAGAATSVTPASYTIERIFTLGASVGDPPVKTKDYLAIGGLNDSGQLVFDTNTASGGNVLVKSETGTLTTLVRGGGVAPGGVWPKNISIYSPTNLNQSGDVAFAGDVTIGGKPSSGTFFWSQQTGQISPIAIQGMPARGSISYVLGGDSKPVLNASDEIAFMADVKNAAGQTNRGVFFRGRDGQVQPVILPDDLLPGGAPATYAEYPSLNDAGIVGFAAHQKGISGDQAYLWENGTVTLLVGAGAPIEGGATLTGVVGITLGNDGASAVVTGTSNQDNSNVGLYLVASGKVRPAAVWKQAMPGGGTYLNRQPWGISAANARGQRVFFAHLMGSGSPTAAYLMESDGSLSLILQSGTMTDLGKVTNVGEGSGNSFGVGFNNLGQVALTVKIAGVAGDELVVLSPVSP